MRSIAQKVKIKQERSLASIMHAGRSDLVFSSLAIETYPEIAIDRLKAIQRKNPKVKKLAPREEYEIKTSSFDVTPYMFSDEEPTDDWQLYYRILGLSKSKRVWKWIKKEYVEPRKANDNNLDKYKILIPKAIGSGHFGETLGVSILGNPGDSSTPTFISIGKFRDFREARHVEVYICTKFVRALLGILKITHDNIPSKWKYVPLQNFSEDSDIDWNQSISSIDQQLYKKYELTEEEISFIEKNVKEMK